MTCDLAETSPGGPWYRIGRHPDPWVWPDWSYAGPDGTFGGRFDDPDSSYRVLYAASRPLGAYLETMAWARPDPAVDLDVIAISDPADEDDYAAGLIPRDWIDRRRLGRACAAGTLAAVGHSQSLSRLRGSMAGSMAAHGVAEVDAAAIRETAPRAFTQDLGRLVYRCLAADGRTPAYDGIMYASKHGDDVECWALFEGRGDLTDTESLRIDPADSDLAEALRLLRVEIDWA